MENNPNDPTTKKPNNRGHIVQIIGPVVDVEFKDNLPAIYNALKVKLPNDPTTKKPSRLILEVQSHLGERIVRSVAMGSTDGLRRGQEVIDSEKPISVPVGEEVLGRIINVVGNPIDNKGPIEPKNQKTKQPNNQVKRYPIHRPAPGLTEQETKQEVLETGIKVIDLVAPFIKGGKIGV